MPTIIPNGDQDNTGMFSEYADSSFDQAISEAEQEVEEGAELIPAKAAKEILNKEYYGKE